MSRRSSYAFERLSARFSDSLTICFCFVWEVLRFQRFVVGSVACEDKSSFWIRFKVTLNLM
jgi:hypothetical protein